MQLDGKIRGCSQNLDGWVGGVFKVRTQWKGVLRFGHGWTGGRGVSKIAFFSGRILFRLAKKLILVFFFLCDCIKSSIKGNFCHEILLLSLIWHMQYSTNSWVALVFLSFQRA